MIHAIGHASGSQIPQLKKSTDPDFCFTPLMVSLKMYLSSLSAVFDVLLDSPPAMSAGIRTTMTVAQKENYDYAMKHYYEYQGTEKRGTAAIQIFCSQNQIALAVVMDLHTRAKNIAMAANMVGRAAWKVAAAAAAAEDPPRAALSPYLDARPFVACVVQTTALNNHFDLQNELLGSVRKRELGRIALGKGEPTTTMTVRLQQACHRVDEVCAHPLTEFELKEHMENILVKSTENSDTWRYRSR
jgi:hypothetical protein